MEKLEINMKLKTILNEILSDSNLNDNFKKWFAGSKVTDGSKPKIVYHGSPDANIKSFKSDKIGSNSDTGMYGRGFYFSDNKKYADSYNRSKTGTTYEIYLSIKNPLIIKNKEDIPNIDVPNSTIEDMMNGPENYSKMFTEFLENNGYDGVISHLGNAGVEYVALYPNQIKSAQNDGTWSNSDNINS